MALGGESSGFVLNSMECYTLGYDGWRCSIPTAVALSGIPEPTQVMPTMRTQRMFPAVCSADYTIFVVGTSIINLLNVVFHNSLYACMLNL